MCHAAFPAVPFPRVPRPKIKSWPPKIGTDGKQCEGKQLSDKKLKQLTRNFTLGTFPSLSEHLARVFHFVFYRSCPNFDGSSFVHRIDAVDSRVKSNYTTRLRFGT